MKNDQNLGKNDAFTMNSDSPLNVGEKDLLNMEEVHQSLINLIEGADTPITIALKGEWGSGKTSLMNIIKDKLCKGDDAKFYSVTVNTWKFSMFDLTHQASSQAVVNILQSMVYQIMALKPNNAQQERINEIINKIAISAINVKSVYNVIGEPVLNQFGVNKTTIGFIGKAISVLKSIGDNSKKSKISTDNASLVEQLHQEIESLVNDVLHTNKQAHAQVLPYNSSQDIKYTFLQNKPDVPFNTKNLPSVAVRFIAFLINCLCYLSNLVYFAFCQMFLFIVEFVSNVLLVLWRVFYYALKVFADLIDFFIQEWYNCFSVHSSNFKESKEECTIDNRSKSGFIFFIDDLDRINPALALEILEILKNVFDIKHCIFIIAIDPDVLDEVINKKLENLINKKHGKYQLYLNKLIQFSIAMPVQSYDLTPLLKKELANNSIFTKDELKSSDLIAFIRTVIELSIGKNPRSVKKLLNYLSLFNILSKGLWERYIQYKNTFGRIEFDLFEKKIIFIVVCIQHSYPDIFNALSHFPVFTSWSDDVIKAFDLKPLLPIELDNLFEKIKLTYGIDLTNTEKHGQWEIILFRLCQSKNNLRYNFPQILCLLKKMDYVFVQHLKQNNLNEQDYSLLLSKLLNAACGARMADDFSIE